MIAAYLQRLYGTIVSRGYIEVEWLTFDEMPGRQGFVEDRLKFYDGSLLDFDETVLVRYGAIVKLRYAYHFQDKSGEMAFRYDNAPHYPQIVTYPHHQHIGSSVEPAEAPDLSEILREIERLIFAPGSLPDSGSTE